jgi:hypothetical protein
MADIGPIPLRRPTTLTGRNDSGKTAKLDALAFLLGDGHRTQNKVSKPPGAGTFTWPPAGTSTRPLTRLSGRLAVA